MSAIEFSDHDHTACMRSTMQEAESQCAARGLRLTPVRRRVLEILLAEHRALGAYDLLAHLSADFGEVQIFVDFIRYPFQCRYKIIIRIKFAERRIVMSFIGNLAMLGAVSPMMLDRVNSTDEMIAAAEKELVRRGIAKDAPQESLGRHRFYFLTS